MNFRRWITALAVLTLFVGLAAAQTSGGGETAMTCQTVAQVTPTIRSEGLTEMVGDIVITCQGGSPVAIGAAIPQGNIVISLTAPVTSRLASGNPPAGANGQPSEALLMVDEPNSGLPGPVPGFGPGAPINVCTTPGTGCVEYAGTLVGYPYTVALDNAADQVPGRNVFQGNVASPNTVSFQGVPFLPPVSAGVVRVYRITNIRVNATNAGSSLVSGFGQVQAQISTNGASTLPISLAAITVAFVSPSLTPTVTSVGTFQQCSAAYTDSLAKAATATSGVALLNFAEIFPSAFKTRIVPSGTFTSLLGTTSAGYYNPGSTLQRPNQLYSSESGFILPLGFSGSGNNLVQAGLADSGTRLKAVFANLPTGATIYVSVNNITGLGTAITPPAVVGGYNITQTAWAVLSTGGETGLLTQTSATTAAVPLSGATAVWEVVNTNTSANEKFTFGVYIAYAANAPALTGTPATPPTSGLPSVTLSYAPTPTSANAAAWAAASSSAPIPRFIIGANSVANGIINIIPCQTILLFPYVIDTAGFDTGLAISNTSMDPLGTTTTTGFCTLYFYGPNAPTTPPVSPTIPPGTQWATSMSAIVPSMNFAGYMFAQCTFQYAHGFAFVSDFGSRNLAMGYLALVVNNQVQLAGRGLTIAGEGLEN